MLFLSVFLVVKHEHNKNFFRAVAVSWNKETKNILSRTHERKLLQENFRRFFSYNTGQSTWQKLNELSKIRQEKNSYDICFCVIFTVAAKICGEETGH